jgi:polyhydroxybutyrate depolymerase
MFDRLSFPHILIISLRSLPQVIIKNRIPVLFSILNLMVLCSKEPTNTDTNQFTIILTPTHISSYNGSDGSIDLTVLGGTSPYQYNWSNGDSTEDLNNLEAGTYSVTVTDADAQMISDSTIINQPPDPLQNRMYNFHVPQSYTGSNAVPLVIALHHYGSNGDQFEPITGFNPVADTAGFIVVYPDATGAPSEWNAGIGLTPSTLAINDVEFISAIIDKFSINYNIDTNRVYVVGFSNGSIMTHRLAAELSSKITAIGAVAGQATNQILNSLSPDRPVAIIHFHMLDDPSLSYYGGSLNNISYPAVEDVISAWISINKCLTQPTILINNAEVLGRTWVSTESHADITLYTITSGGHTWPDHPVSATELMWKFFKNHPRETG